MLASVLAAVPLLAWSGDYQKMGFVSDTVGVDSNRICVGAPSAHRPSDYGCPSYAPSLTTAGDVSITGNVSAAKFIGDGSGITGVTASSADRITSGTTSFIVISDTGYISLTQAGTNTGWFSPYSGLVTLGVSSTGGISGTTGYFSGNVGVGTNAPTEKLSIEGSGAQGLSIYSTDTGVANTAKTFIRLYGMNSANTKEPQATLSSAAGSPLTSSGQLIIATADGSGISRERFRVNGSGNVGIGTTAPNATLQVSGSFIVSTSAQTTTPSLYVDTNGKVGMGTTAPSSTLHIFNPGFGARLIVQDANYTLFDVGSGAVTLQPYPTGGPNGFAFKNYDLGWNLRTVINSIRDGVDSYPVLQLQPVGGKVGIGIASPTTALEVSGTISATALVINGQSISGQGDRIVSGTTSMIAYQNGDISTTASLNVSGTIKIAGTGAEVCDSQHYNMIRVNPATGAVEICRQ